MARSDLRAARDSRGSGPSMSRIEPPHPLRWPFDAASLSGPRTVKLRSMPMLHGCAFRGCSTFTLSTYCVEHELLVRALKESEREHAVALDEDAEDAALSADPAGATQQPAAI